MDPIDAITKIAGGVLRRIADAIDTAPATEPAVTIHVGVLHVHSADPATVARGATVGADQRSRFSRRS